MAFPQQQKLTFLVSCFCFVLAATITTSSTAFVIPTSRSLRRSPTLLYSDVNGETASDSVDSISSSSSTSSTSSRTTSASSSSTDADTVVQASTEMNLPDTYVRCGKCQTSFAMTIDDLGGENSKGRRLECSVCSHSWFQSKDRIMTMKDGFEMVARPQYEIERVHLNLRENKAPNFLGEQKLYVGNIAFECQEQDIVDAFSVVGTVGDVSLVRDDDGRNRGFGFVTMRTIAEGERAISELNGAEIKGRSIAVRPSNN